MANPNMIAGMPSVNPAGRPKSIFQDLGPRRAHFLETLSRDEILALVDDDTRLGKYSGFDAQILLGLADTLRKTPEDKLDPGKERERMYDREIGKPPQTVALQGGDPDKPIQMQRHFTQEDLLALRRYIDEIPGEQKLIEQTSVDKQE